MSDVLIEKRVSLSEAYKLSKTNLSQFKSVVIQKLDAPNPNWWVASYNLSKNPIGAFYQNKDVSAAGTSIYKEEALIRATGEAIERYCCLNSHFIDEFVLREFLNNGDVRFARCADFENSPHTFKNSLITEKVEHCMVKNLLTEQEVLIPAEFVHLGFPKQRKNLLTSPISTGAAFYYDIDTAIFKGICEVVERDAMMRFWHQKKKPKEIIIDKHTGNFELEERIFKIKEAGLNLRLFEISDTIKIPTIFAILISTTYPYYCTGASSNTDILKAVTKAIDETISIRAMALTKHPLNNMDINNFNWVNSLEDHMVLYANWKDSPAFDFFIHDSTKLYLNDLKKTEWIPEPRNKNELVVLAKVFAEKGFHIFWKDVTLPETKKFGNTVKVIIPEMIPLSQSFSARFLNSFGLEQENLNIYPHTFA